MKKFCSLVQRVTCSQEKKFSYASRQVFSSCRVQTAFCTMSAAPSTSRRTEPVDLEKSKKKYEVTTSCVCTGVPVRQCQDTQFLNCYPDPQLCRCMLYMWQKNLLFPSKNTLLSFWYDMQCKMSCYDFTMHSQPIECHLLGSLALTMDFVYLGFKFAYEARNEWQDICDPTVW